MELEMKKRLVLFIILNCISFGYLPSLNAVGREEKWEKPRDEDLKTRKDTKELRLDAEERKEKAERLAKEGKDEEAAREEERASYELLTARIAENRFIIEDPENRYTPEIKNEAREWNTKLKETRAQLDTELAKLSKAIESGIVIAEKPKAPLFSRQRFTEVRNNVQKTITKWFKEASATTRELIGDIKGARRVREQLNIIYEDLGDLLAQARNKKKLGNLYKDLGEEENLLKNHLDALDTYIKAGDFKEGKPLPENIREEMIQTLIDLEVLKEQLGEGLKNKMKEREFTDRINEIWDAMDIQPEELLAIEFEADIVKEDRQLTPEAKGVITLLKTGNIGVSDVLDTFGQWLKEGIQDAIGEGVSYEDSAPPEKEQEFKDLVENFRTLRDNADQLTPDELALAEMTMKNFYDEIGRLYKQARTDNPNIEKAKVDNPDLVDKLLGELLAKEVEHQRASREASEEFNASWDRLESKSERLRAENPDEDERLTRREVKAKNTATPEEVDWIISPLAKTADTLIENIDNPRAVAAETKILRKKMDTAFDALESKDPSRATANGYEVFNRVWDSLISAAEKRITDPAEFKPREAEALAEVVVLAQEGAARASDNLDADRSDLLWVMATEEGIAELVILEQAQREKPSPEMKKAVQEYGEAKKAYDKEVEEAKKSGVPPPPPPPPPSSQLNRFRTKKQTEDFKKLKQTNSAQADLLKQLQDGEIKAKLRKIDRKKIEAERTAVEEVGVVEHQIF